MANRFQPGCACCCNVNLIAAPRTWATDELRAANGWQRIEATPNYRYTASTLPPSNWQLAGASLSNPEAVDSQFIFNVLSVSGEQPLFEIRGATSGSPLLTIKKRLLEFGAGIPARMVLSIQCENQPPVELSRSRRVNQPVDITTDGAGKTFRFGRPEGPPGWIFQPWFSYPLNFAFARIAKRNDSLVIEFDSQANNSGGVLPGDVHWFREIADWNYYTPDPSFPARQWRFLTQGVSQESIALPLTQAWNEDFEIIATTAMQSNMVRGKIGTDEPLNTFVTGTRTRLQLTTPPVRCGNPGYSVSMPSHYQFPDWDVSTFFNASTSLPTGTKIHRQYGFGNQSAEFFPGATEPIRDQIETIEDYVYQDVNARFALNAIQPRVVQFVLPQHRFDNRRNVRFVFLDAPLNVYVPPPVSREHLSQVNVASSVSVLTTSRVFPELSSEATTILANNSLTVERLQRFFGEGRDLSTLVGMTDPIKAEMLNAFDVADTQLKIRCETTLTGMGRNAPVTQFLNNNSIQVVQSPVFWEPQGLDLQFPPTSTQLIVFEKTVSRWAGELPNVSLGYADIVSVTTNGIQYTKDNPACRIFWVNRFNWSTSNIRDVVYSGFFNRTTFVCNLAVEYFGIDTLETMEMRLTKPANRPQAGYFVP